MGPPCCGGGAYGLQGSCRSRFWGLQGEKLTKSPPILVLIAHLRGC